MPQAHSIIRYCDHQFLHCSRIVSSIDHDILLSKCDECNARFDTRIPICPLVHNLSTFGSKHTPLFYYAVQTTDVPFSSQDLTFNKQLATNSRIYDEIDQHTFLSPEDITPSHVILPLFKKTSQQMPLWVITLSGIVPLMSRVAFMTYKCNRYIIWLLAKLYLILFRIDGINDSFKRIHDNNL